MSNGEDRIIIEAGEDDAGRRRDGRNAARMLSFSLGGENYCVDARCIKEVVKLSEVTSVPGTPDFVTGIMNLRGEIISLIDIRYFFGLGEERMTKDTRVIVTDLKGGPMGIVIDGVKGTICVEETSVQPTLSTIKGRLASYTTGQVEVGNEILAVLDLERILDCEEIEGLRGGTR